MKKIFTIVLIALSQHCVAQQIDTSTNYIDSLEEVLPNTTQSYTQIVDSILQGISKAQMQTHILYDRILPIEATNADTITSTSFEQLWFQLENAHYQYKNPLNSQNLSSTVYKYNGENTLPIMALNVDYESIDTTAFHNDRLHVIDNLVSDGDMNKPSPFAMHNACRVAMVAKTDLEANVNYKIMYNNFDWQEANNAIQSIIINIEQLGIKQTIEANKDYTLNFPKEGKYYIAWDVTLVDGTHHHLTQIIPIKKTRDVLRDTTLCPNESQKYLLTSNRSFLGPDGNYSAQGDVYFYQHKSINHNCNEPIRNPIIFIDGYDDHSTRDVEHIYNSYLRMNLTSSDTVSVGDSLRVRGYDVIILNPRAQYEPIYSMDVQGHIIGIVGYRMVVDGGTDYCQRNAYLLETLIQRVNDSLQVSNPNGHIVVIGPSMGGQIARYALADMERSGINHNVRLYVSFDSPHNGANIAMCLQDYFKFLAPFSNDAKITLNEKLLTNFGRQIIIHQTDRIGDVFTQNWDNSSPQRVNYMDSLAVLGYPNLCRKVALINGRGSGGYYHAPASQAYKFRGYSQFIAGWTLADLKGWYLPEYQHTINRNFSGLLTVFLFGTLPIPIKFQSYGKPNTSIYSSLDGIPGSDYNIQKDLFDQATSSNFWKNNYFNYITFQQTFIPAASSLGFINPNFDWSTPIPDNLVCNNLIPFDNYYIPDDNEEHVAITKKSYDWVIQEIEKGKKNSTCLPQICGLTKINGSVNICMNSSFQYHLNMAIPAGYTYNWVVSNNITKSNETNSSVTVNTTIAGDAWIRLIITNPCGANWVIEKNITIQPNPIATVPSFTVTPNSGCKNMVDIDFTSYPYQSMSWLVHWGSTSAAFTTNGTSLTTSHIVNCGSPKNVEALVTASNTCGISNILYTCNVQCDGTYNVTFRKKNIKSEIYNFQVYPNPADINWVLSIKNKDIKDLTLNLTDINGKLVYTKNYNNLSADNLIIPCENLSKGMYILNVIYAEKVESFKLIKE